MKEFDQTLYHPLVHEREEERFSHPDGDQDEPLPVPQNLESFGKPFMIPVRGLMLQLLND